MTQTPTRVPTSPSEKYDPGMTTKITVSLPDYQVEEARRAVAEGRAKSVSGYVSDALAEYGEGGLDAVLEDLHRTIGPPTPEETAWADEMLRR